MKSNKVLFGLMACGLAMAGLTQSCVSDAPFADGEGEGTLRMHLVVNSNVTRSTPDNEEELRSKCVVYISNQSGLLYSYESLNDVPEQLRLKSGNYIAEAWTGDSVTASFDKKFYRGYQPFSIKQGDNTQVILTCRIANVVVSVNPETIDADLMRDWKITVSNSRGYLEFDEGNMNDAKGYFMMPNSDILRNSEGEIMKSGDDGWTLYTNLKYKIEGTNASGASFVKEGYIGGSKGEGVVEHAHEYQLNLSYNPQYQDEGGAFITVTVNDTETVVTEEVALYSRPAIKGVGFNIEKQLFAPEGEFTDRIVKVAGFGELTDVTLSSESWETFGWPSEEINTRKAVNSVESAMNDLGISWDYGYNADRNLAIQYIYFAKEFLNSLGENQYEIDLYAKDKAGKSFSQKFRLAVGEGAIVVEDPVTVNPIVPGENLLAVGAKKVTLTGQFNSDDVQEAQIRYRKASTADSWSTVPVMPTRTMNFTVVLHGLNPGTTYEYQVVAGDFESEKYFFTTETTFTIPNGNMEEWSTYKNNTSNVVFAGSGSTRTFWDSGNQGAALLPGTVLTNSSTEIFHSATKSARLETKSILSKLAAGNLFVGEFGSTVGTTGAKLKFGREYTGNSHPTALSVYVNYRPKAVSTTTNKYIQKGETDQGQIFVAFATGQVELNTASGIYFDPKGEQILGYGQVTFTGNVGEDGDMARVEIPVEWYSKAKTVKPTHIIIVCAASKYGDYFEGGAGSLMYLDDFELVY